MASGTADLQRDLGGAIMQSIFGALLTSGYTSSAQQQIDASPQSISDSVQGILTKSFASAANLAEQYPAYSDQIIAAARTAFLKGDNEAYVAGLIAVALGAAIVFGLFPKKDGEQRLLDEYAAEDRGG
jgi:hypothetical protein